MRSICAMAQQSVAPQQHFVSALLPPRGGRVGGGTAAGVTGSSGDLCCACTGCQRTAKMGCHGWRKFNQPSIVHEPRVCSWHSVLEESCRQVDLLTSGEWRETSGIVCQYTSVLGGSKEGDSLSWWRGRCLMGRRCCNRRANGV